MRNNDEFPFVLAGIGFFGVLLMLIAYKKPNLPCNYFSVIERTKCITDARVEK